MKYAGSVPLMEVRLSQPHNENENNVYDPVHVCHWQRHGHSTEEYEGKS